MNGDRVAVHATMKPLLTASSANMLRFGHTAATSLIYGFSILELISWTFPRVSSQSGHIVTVV